MGKESTNFPQMTNKTITQSNDFNSKLNIVKINLPSKFIDEIPQYKPKKLIMSEKKIY